MNKAFLKDFVNIIHKHEDKDDVIYEIVKFLRDNLHVFSVAIRLQDGDDYPFYTTLGFTDRFIKSENFLCCKGKDGKIVRDKYDKATLECMCGSIINKCVDPSKRHLSCYTEHGSFWTNSAKALIDETKGDVGVKTRGTCIETGYKSIAIIPIPYKGINIGLIQLNDFEENKFTLDTIESVEELAAMIGCVIGHIDTTKALKNDKIRLAKENLKLITKDLKNMSESILKKTEM
jgi:hypothetical protein